MGIHNSNHNNGRYYRKLIDLNRSETNNEQWQRSISFTPYSWIIIQKTDWVVQPNL